MIRILLVDDEPQFRTHMTTLLDWQAHGFSLQTASSARAALACLEAEEYDIVFTDMNMPNMSGVELIRQCRQRGCGAVFVALSGFSDYAYVRESLTCGAVDYLLKNDLTETSLLNFLDQLRDKIASTRTRRDLDSSLRMDMIRQNCRHILLADTAEAEAFRTLLKELDFPLLDGRVSLCVFEVDNFSDVAARLSRSPAQMERLKRSLLSTCQSVIDDCGAGVAVGMGESARYALLFSGGRTASTLFQMQCAANVMGRVRSSLSKLLNINCTFAAGAFDQTFSTLHECYLRSCAALDAKFYFQPGCILPAGVPAFTSEAIGYNDIENIVSQISAGSAGHIREQLSAKFELFRQNRTAPALVCAWVSCVAANAIVYARKAHVPKADQLADGGSHALADQHFEFACQAEEFLTRFFEKITEAYKEQHCIRQYSDVTQKAILFIVEHYQEPLSLDDVARSIGVNSTYLSRVFKKDVSVGFVEYLNRKRVQRAKELICQDVRLKDVVVQTGFSNYNYFFKVFKEFTGCTPKDFKHGQEAPT